MWGYSVCNISVRPAGVQTRLDSGLFQDFAELSFINLHRRYDYLLPYYDFEILMKDRLTSNYLRPEYLSQQLTSTLVAYLSRQFNLICLFS